MNRGIAIAISSLLAWSGAVHAADTGQLPCRSTAECNQEAVKAGAATASPAGAADATSKTDQAEDQFYWMNKINKASAVMLTEEKIISPEMGRKIAEGVRHVIEQARQPGGRRPSDVL
ncbi:MAG: argininosuccinate lyase, partial [Gammaproteobacteria bacterium]